MSELKRVVFLYEEEGGEGGGVALSAIARRFRQIKDFVFVGEVCTLDVYFTAEVCSSWDLARSATVN